MKAKVGDVVTIVANTVAHEFEIGEIVRIVKVFSEGRILFNYKAEYLDGSDFWHIDDDDFEIL